jgi:signal transduction histidine kinase
MHNLRTPLTSLSLSTSMLKSGKGDASSGKEKETAEEHVGDLQSAVGHLKVA